VNGPTNAQATLRLFGQSEADVRVTLYRDNHAWCPYCQKVWLWLEEKRIPYRIKKITMFCYGEKERWYKRKSSLRHVARPGTGWQDGHRKRRHLAGPRKRLWPFKSGYGRSPLCCPCGS
jgi:glutaredoxin